MEVSLQKTLEGNGFGRVKIVRLENTNNGVLGMTGYDEQGTKYKLLPADKNKNLAVMTWLGNEGTDQMRVLEGVMNLLALKGTQNSNGDLFVGPAVNYLKSEVKVDEKGVALWLKAVKQPMED